MTVGEVWKELVAPGSALAIFAGFAGKALWEWVKARRNGKVPEGATIVVESPTPKAAEVCQLHDGLKETLRDVVLKLDAVKDAVVDEGRKSGERITRLEATQENLQKEIAGVFDRLNRRDT